MPAPDSVPDPAVAALARVRASTRSRASGRDTPPVRLSSARPDDRDPQSLGAGMSQWLRANGYTTSLAVAGLTERWPTIVGAQVAAHVTIGEFAPGPTGGRLILLADSPEWAVQVRYLLADLRRRIDEELGSGVVTSVDIHGPAKRRTPGGWRVRSGRRSPR